MRTERLFLAISLALAAAALPSCGGGGQYGYAREYQPLGEEQELLRRATDTSYEDVRRARVEDQPYISWFGVVAEPPTTEGDVTRLVLSLRAHQDRHLCAEAGSETCSVTVSDREIARFTALIHQRPEDAADGQLHLWTGSLVRVYGRSTGNDASDLPIIQADWYRHWPVHYYVTTAAAGSMRR